MAWTDLNPDDLAQVSYPEMGSRMTIRREPGPTYIYAIEQPQGSKRVLFLRIPVELYDRMDRTIHGSKNTAVVAILDEALDRLEKEGNTWRVIAPSIKN